MPALCVFCGSSPGARKEYMDAATDIGTAIATDTDWRLVYGGGNRGCMGAVSAACLGAGGRVLGVIPEAMVKSKPRGHPTSEATSASIAPSSGEPGGAAAVSNEGQGSEILRDPAASQGTLETAVVGDMHTRKQRMAKEADLGFVGLPGGYGTLEEVFEMVTWTQLGIHRKPIVLVNICNFYEPLRALVEKAIEDRFIPDHGRPIITFVDDSDAQKAGSWGRAMIAKVQAANEAMRRSGESGYFVWDQQNGTATSATQDAAHAGVARSVKRKRPVTVAETPTEQLSVSVENLTFAFSAGASDSTNVPSALRNCNLSLTRGSRCLLIGANGAGKSTILRLLAGKRMPARDSHMRVFGRDVFYDSLPGITYLGTEWAMNPVVRSDIKVSAFLDSVGGYRHKERRDQLLDILDVDLDWRMHSVSDGERRRVQLTMGLMAPWDLLLLDEVTVDLDVQVRADLLSFLARETEERGATIIYATHIFDGLEDFPTHLVHMRGGTTTTVQPIPWPPLEPGETSVGAQGQDATAALPALASEEQHHSSRLFHTALAWLREDRKVRAETEAQEGGKPRRGAKRDGAETDSERFFSKYDYGQQQQR